MPRAPSSSLPPLGVWSMEANASRFAAMEASLPALLTSLTSSLTHHFRRDLLAFYKATELLPHPQLLPFHPDEELPVPGAGTSATSSRTTTTPTDNSVVIAYDLSEIDTLTVKNWQIDDGSFHGLCFALQHCPSIHTVKFFNVQLRADQTDHLCRLLPQTQVTRFHLDWNSNVSAASVSATALEELLTAASSNITTLSLRSSGLTCDHGVAIARALRSSPGSPTSKLELLNLHDNCIGDTGALAIAYALPFNSSLKSLSLGSTHLSGKTATVLVQVISPRYAAPPSLLKMMEENEPRIQAELDAAKKAKKKIDRATAIQNLALPVLELVEGVQYARGNTSLEDLVLSGNNQITESDALEINTVLDNHGASMEMYLKRIKLQRIPALKAFASGYHAGGSKPHALLQL